MGGKSLFHCLPPLLVIVVCLFQITILSAQQQLERRLNFEAKNEKLSDVLDRLSATENLNFSYNPAEASFSVPIDYSAQNKTLNSVLSEILRLSGHDFRQVGNQIVVFAVGDNIQARTRPEIPETDDAIVGNTLELPDDMSRPLLFPDTLLVFDTLYIRDTLVLTDTLVIRDTIFVKEEVKTPRPEHPKPLRDGIFRMEPDRNNSWYFTAHYTQMRSSASFDSGNTGDYLSLLRESENSSWNNMGLGVDISKAVKKIQFGGGIQFTRFSNPFYHSWEKVEGGFYVTDTIESYYTVVQADTTWYYFTDSTWIPRDVKAFVFDQINCVSYIGLPVNFGYNLYSSQQLNVYVKGGVVFDILIKKRGNTILDEDAYPDVSFAELDFNPLMISWSAAAGARYRIYDWFDLNGEIVYRNHLNSMIRNFPATKRMGAAGIRIGLIYYF